MRSAPRSVSNPRRAASRYGGMAVWSGDTVRRDANRLLYFVGRDDAMIKTAGNRVSPTEVEDVAVASGLIYEAVAFGVPDPRLGAAIVLIVRGKAGGRRRRGAGGPIFAGTSSTSCSRRRSNGGAPCRAIPTASSTAWRSPPIGCKR